MDDTIHVLAGNHVVPALQHMKKGEGGRPSRVAMWLLSRRIATPGHDIDVVSKMMHCRGHRLGR